MSNEREVTIRLKVAIDQAGKAGLAELQKAAQQSGAAMQAAATSSVQATEKAVKQQQAAMDTALRQHQAASQKLFGSMMQVREAGMMALGGVTQLGRGLAILGVSGEKDVQKVLQSLLKIQAAFDVLRGGSAVVFGLAKAWNAYEASVKASAAAHAALAAAQAASTRGAVAGGAVQAGAAVVPAAAPAAGGGIGATVGAAAAAVAAWGLVLWELVEILRGTASEADSVTGRIASAEVSAASWTARKMGLQGVFGAMPGWTPAGATAEMMGAEDKTARMEAARRESQRQAAWDRGESAFNLQIMQAQLSGGLIEPGAALSAARKEGNLAMEVSAMQALAAKDQERLRLAQERARESLGAAREELSLAKSTLEAERQRESALRSRYETAKERFGGMAPEEQQSLLRIGEKARKGGALSREEAAALRGLGLESTMGQARAADFARAEAAGFEKTFGQTDRAALEASQRAVARMTLDVKAKQEIVVKMDNNVQSFANQIAAAMKQSNAELAEVIVKKMRADREDQINRALGSMVSGLVGAGG